MTFFLWVTSFCFFTTLFVVVLYELNKKKWKMRKRILSLINGSRATFDIDQGKEEKEVTFNERVIFPFIHQLRQFTIGKMSTQRMEALENKLREAGNPFGMKPVDFRIAQVLLSTVLFIFSYSILGAKSDEGIKVLIMSLIFSLFGYYYFTYYLNAKKKARNKEIEKSMSDFFDMVTVSIEAGMGLDGALKKVCHQMHSPLSHEFLYALEDMKLGKSRRHAFIEMRDRIPSEFFRSIINSIIQADQMGIGMTKVLRAQTQRIRENQRQRVKEQAMRAPIKMLIPMIIFIFPTLFVVLLGPVIVDVVTKWL